MQYKIKTDPKRMIGKRPNLAAQNSVADEIVTRFASQQDQPIVPLSPIEPGKPSPWGKIFSIIGAALVFAPFVIPAVLMIISSTNGYNAPFLMYPFLVLGYRLYALVGGIVLYLAARKVKAFRKTVGWFALINFVVAVPLYIIAVWYNLSSDPAALATDTMRILTSASMIASVLCMIALFVFSVLLIIRAFKKKPKEAVVESN